MATTMQLKLLAPMLALLVTTGCNEGGFSGSSDTGSKRLTGDAKGSPNGGEDNTDDDDSGMKDLDGDGVPDLYDRAPRNPYRD